MPDALYFTCGRARAFFAPNLWSPAAPELRKIMERYYRVMKGLSHTVVEVFARALGKPDDFFDDKIDRHSSSLRLIRYPGRITGAAERQRRRAP